MYSDHLKFHELIATFFPYAETASFDISAIITSTLTGASADLVPYAEMTPPEAITMTSIITVTPTVEVTPSLNNSPTSGTRRAGHMLISETLLHQLSEFSPTHSNLSAGGMVDESSD